MDNKAELKKIFEQAVLNQKKNNLDKANELFSRVLKAFPNDLATLNNIGNIYKEQKKYKLAADYYNKALSVNSNDIITNFNLALLFHLLDRFKEAIELYNKIIKINPRHIRSYINLMEIYDKTNNELDLENIISSYESSLKQRSEISLYKSRLYLRRKKYQEVINMLEEINFQEDQIHLEQLRVFTLGKAYDFLKEPDNAFKNFSLSNEIDFKIKNKKINKSLYLKEIEKRQEYFQNYKPRNKRQVSQKIEGPFFMIGFPRSGTTLLDTILRSHSSIEVIEEKPLVERLVKNLDLLSQNNFNNLEKVSEGQINNIKDIYLKELKINISKNNDKKILIDKLPLNLIYIGEILKVFPNSKFIFSLRHPCDCVLSCFMQNFKINNAMANFLNIEDSAKLYDSSMKLWETYLSNFNPNYIEVKYEDLVDNFNKTILSILKFLKLPWEDSVLRFNKTAKDRFQIKTPSYDQVIQPIYKSATNRWKLYEKQLSKVYPTLEPWIKKFNY